jgi:hypothetical protein
MLPLTGALGKRTVHQTQDKAQLVVLATSRRRTATDAATKPATSSISVADQPVDQLGLGLLRGGYGGGGNQGGNNEHSGTSGAMEQVEKETAGLELNEDVLMVPQLRDEEGKVRGVVLSCW